MFDLDTNWLRYDWKKIIAVTSYPYSLLLNRKNSVAEEQLILPHQFYQLHEERNGRCCESKKKVPANSWIVTEKDFAFHLSRNWIISSFCSTPEEMYLSNCVFRTQLCKNTVNWKIIWEITCITSFDGDKSTNTFCNIIILMKFEEYSFYAQTY